MDMGDTILSKWPITDAVGIALPIRTDQSGLEEYFFFHRDILKVKIAVPSHDLYVFNG